MFSVLFCVCKLLVFNEREVRLGFIFSLINFSANSNCAFNCNISKSFSINKESLCVSFNKK
ncbi:hypothetical protein NOVO_01200 [Rickettsiales bacterium Ac37b]|nr:hypothetical protein NOVO_01200 [Rickettsiales bacterium Ac37b]